MLSRGSQVPWPEPTLGFFVWVSPEADPKAGFEGKQFLWEVGSERWVGGGEKGQRMNTASQGWGFPAA